MKSIRARRAFDATPVENRIEHFPSQIIGVMWTKIIIGSAKHEILRSDILGAFKMLHRPRALKVWKKPDGEPYVRPAFFFFSRILCTVAHERNRGNQPPYRLSSDSNRPG